MFTLGFVERLSISIFILNLCPLRKGMSSWGNLVAPLMTPCIRGHAFLYTISYFQTCPFVKATSYLYANLSVLI